MKILIATTSSNNTDTVIGSLDCLGQHQISVFRYDEKWHSECGLAIQADPGVRDLLSMGLFPPPEHRDAFRMRVSREAELLALVKAEKFDLVLYISAWEGLFVPTNETLGQVKSMTPLVHLLFDGADPPWWVQLEEFERAGVFSLTVNIDGSHAWPGGDWRSTPDDASIPGWKIENALTLLTPLDPRHFQGPPFPPPFLARPFPIAYAGNAGGWTRGGYVRQLQQEIKRFHYRQRDDHPHSYKIYCDFLRHSRAVVSVPFTGSGAATHVKGRVLETGYAGAALLEYEGSPTKDWFEPGADYLTYSDVGSLITVATHMAENPHNISAYAANLHRRVTTEHAPEVFWGKVFAQLGIGE